MGLTVHELEGAGYARYQPRVSALEEGVTYPLGQDRFAVDHGADYFAFFRRLGELAYFVVRDEERVVAVCAAVLRRLPPVAGRGLEATWYLCDLKVDPAYRSQRIPWLMFRHGFPGKYARCRRGYAVTMNPGDGSPNPVVRLVTHFHLAPASVGAVLNLYSLPAEAMREHAPVLAQARGPLGYLSLRGVKDIVLASSGAPMPLAHVQFGPTAAPGVAEPLEGHEHMFCVPTTDPLVSTLAARGLAPTATASVIHHRMSDWDWRFILTSDI